MSTSAELSSDGSSYVINGTKMWITNGTVDGSSTGDAFLLYARTGKPGSRGSGDLTSFLIEKGMPGFTLGQKIQVIYLYSCYSFIYHFMSIL